ncbi:MAG: ABC transporter ATP-binding protein, partial [Kocuria sp.]|nr:ABC transporter ATP-binding protein [Kocuria sp.]
HAAQTIENICSRAIWMDRGQLLLDGDAVDVARKYRWFAHNLAQGEEGKAAGLLREAKLEGESQRRASQLDLSDVYLDRPLAKRREAIPEFEPDPFTRVYDRSHQSPRKSFPSTILPDDRA